MSDLDLVFVRHARAELTSRRPAGCVRGMRLAVPGDLFVLDECADLPCRLMACPAYWKPCFPFDEPDIDQPLSQSGGPSLRFPALSDLAT